MCWGERGRDLENVCAWGTRGREEGKQDRGGGRGQADSSAHWGKGRGPSYGLTGKRRGCGDAEPALRPFGCCGGQGEGPAPLWWRAEERGEREREREEAEEALTTEAVTLLRPGSLTKRSLLGSRRPPGDAQKPYEGGRGSVCELPPYTPI